MLWITKDVQEPCAVCNLMQRELVTQATYLARTALQRLYALICSDLHSFSFPRPGGYKKIGKTSLMRQDTGVIVGFWLL